MYFLPISSTKTPMQARGVGLQTNSFPAAWSIPLGPEHPVMGATPPMMSAVKTKRKISAPPGTLYAPAKNQTHAL